jgi:hypothetical protein
MDLSALTSEGPLAIMAGMAVLWFLARSFKTGPSRFSGMFRREAKLPKIGVGKEAIASLLKDMQDFIANEPGLRSLVLMGEFAGNIADVRSEVILVTFCASPESYADPLWRARWAYLARGHFVLDHKVEQGEGFVVHKMRLRGAPEIRFLVLSPEHFALKPPGSLRAALVHPTILIEDQTGIALAIVKAWRHP